MTLGLHNLSSIPNPTTTTTTISSTITPITCTLTHCPITPLQPASQPASYSYHFHSHQQHHDHHQSCTIAITSIPSQPLSPPVHRHLHHNYTITAGHYYPITPRPRIHSTLPLLVLTTMHEIGRSRHKRFCIAIGEQK